MKWHVTKQENKCVDKWIFLFLMVQKMFGTSGSAVTTVGDWETTRAPMLIDEDGFPISIHLHHNPMAPHVVDILLISWVIPFRKFSFRAAKTPWFRQM